MRGPFHKNQSGVSFKTHVYDGESDDDDSHEGMSPQDHGRDVSQLQGKTRDICTSDVVV